MTLPVITNMKGMKEKKWIKTKIGVGSVMTEKFREMEEKTGEGRSRRVSIYVLGCVKAVLGKNNTLVQL